MRYTLRQPAHAAAACAGLALLLGACAPATPQADPTPTATDGCAYLLKAEEGALVRPRAALTVQPAPILQRCRARNTEAHHRLRFTGSSHFGVWGVVLAWGRGLPDD